MGAVFFGEIGARGLDTALVACVAVMATCSFTVVDACHSLFWDTLQKVLPEPTFGGGALRAVTPTLVSEGSGPLHKCKPGAFIATFPIIYR